MFDYIYIFIFTITISIHLSFLEIMKVFNFHTISTECNKNNNNKIKYLLKALNDYTLDIIVTERNRQDNHKIIRDPYTLKGPIHPKGPPYTLKDPILSKEAHTL